MGIQILCFIWLIRSRLEKSSNTASVVKELVENSCDARSTQDCVLMKEAATRSYRSEDDGGGINLICRFGF